MSVERRRAGDRRPAAARRGRGRGRDGFSLIEVMIAMVILGGVLLALGRFVATFAHGEADSSVRATASTLAADRIEQVRGATNYAALDTAFGRTEPTVEGFPRFSRQTVIQRTGGGPSATIDYKTVTVIVSNPALPTPIRRTTIIPDF
jgi:prepilin-type N-terminal cleavage/methylation domain-containing protein